MNRTSLIVLLLVAIPLLGGCPQVGNIRITDDAPEDLDTLLSEHEYMRVRQLTGKYPSLDSNELQSRLRNLEQQYEQDIWSEANSMESGGDLLAAVRILSDALQKMPHSNRLRDLRNSIEKRRVGMLRKNEREILLAKGRYLAAQLRMHDENIKLEYAGLTGQLEHERNLATASTLAAHLITHARYAMDENNLAAAMECLTTSRELHDTQEATTLQTELHIIRQSLERSTQQKASIKQARIKRKQTKEHRELTDKLLLEARAALKANELHAALDALGKIPESRSNDAAVTEIRNQLNQAVATRVAQLVASGDSLYRAEKINPALKAWNEALSLSPDNTEVRERTERANKVLARLKELKRRQH